MCGLRSRTRWKVRLSTIRRSAKRNVNTAPVTLVLSRVTKRFLLLTKGFEVGLTRWWQFATPVQSFLVWWGSGPRKEPAPLENARVGVVSVPGELSGSPSISTFSPPTVSFTRLGFRMFFLISRGEKPLSPHRELWLTAHRVQQMGNDHRGDHFCGQTEEFDREHNSVTASIFSSSNDGFATLSSTCGGLLQGKAPWFWSVPGARVAPPV